MKKANELSRGELILAIGLNNRQINSYRQGVREFEAKNKELFAALENNFMEELLNEYKEGVKPNEQ